MLVRSPSAGTTQPRSAGSAVARSSASSDRAEYSVASSAACRSSVFSWPPAFSPELIRVGSSSPAMVSGRTRTTGPQPAASSLPRPASSAGWPPLTG
ncbi:hypothetical protein SGLAM104S_07354 [Streptomyces glaucescens]